MNYKKIISIVMFLSTFTVFAAHAQTTKPKELSLEKKVENILAKRNLKGKIAIQIGTDEDILFSQDEEELLIPASVTKIITAAAFLDKFPAGTKFKTHILATGKQKDDVLEGPIYFRGSGDPGFVSETMWFLVNNFKRTGIKKIKGGIVADESMFDGLHFDPSRQKNRVDRAYDAPTSALSFNWNSVNVFVRPGKKNEKAMVFLDPENAYVELTGQVTTGTKTNISVERVNKKGRDIVIVSGTIAEGAKEQVVYKNVTDPSLWAAENLKSFLAQRGIEVEGEIRKGKTPDTAEILAEAESKPVEWMVSDMDKFSNNFVAEMLAKQLSAASKKPGSISHAMGMISDFLKKTGVEKKEYNLVNPSGLSRENKLTANALWKVLVYLQKNYRSAPEFMASLPIGGVDGTLKNRYKGSLGEGWVRGKTGYLDGVVALAGYAGLKSGEVLPFVMIYNGSSDESLVRSVMDEIVLTVL